MVIEELFQTRLYVFIVVNDINQSQVARVLKWSTTKLSLMLRGIQKMGIDEYIDICKAIDVDPTSFFDDEYFKELKEDYDSLDLVNGRRRHRAEV